MKKLKIWKIISILGIFIISGILHFGYDLFPSFITSLVFPVNESIWEHNKIIMGAFFLWSLIEKRMFKDKNVFISGFISSIICSILVMVIFTPVYLFILKTNDNIFITFSIFLFAIGISQYISFKLLKTNYNLKYEKIALFLWLIVFVLNAILTYYPLDLQIFYDFTNKRFGR